jgi:hypothetical protein
MIPSDLTACQITSLQSSKINKIIFNIYYSYKVSLEGSPTYFFIVSTGYVCFTSKRAGSRRSFSLGALYFNSNPHTFIASQILTILTYFYILYITLFILLHATVTV